MGSVLYRDLRVLVVCLFLSVCRIHVCYVECVVGKQIVVGCYFCLCVLSLINTPSTPGPLAPGLEGGGAVVLHILDEDDLPT
jgi:hypothetical protein